ncbi:MAG: TfoX/Sxy family protein [Bacteroidetes bacterium]|nr:TfoX/Sxy family protein [Bacteroidota bacterium]MBU1579639.1 TfoX/Sxy family protein [Bacteroidota bacterium]MBU2556716.1 TfoX/Sxy family protein [Bacteroidota bacterium]
MATSEDFMQFVLDQLNALEGISHRKMFGEYGVYYQGKIFGLVCDNQLFIKPTESGRAFIGSVQEAPPYPGAKNSFLITEQLENSAWLQELVKITAAELPEPKPKTKKKR